MAWRGHHRPPPAQPRCCAAQKEKGRPRALRGADTLAGLQAIRPADRSGCCRLGDAGVGRQKWYSARIMGVLAFDPLTFLGLPNLLRQYW